MSPLRRPEPLQELAHHGLLPDLLQERALGRRDPVSHIASTGGDGNKNSTQARRQTPSPFLSDVLYAFPAARNGGHFTGSPFAAPSRPRFQPYHGRRLPPATQRRPPPPAFGSRGRRLGRRRFAMFTGGLVDADDDAFADFDDY